MWSIQSKLKQSRFLEMVIPFRVSSFVTHRRKKKTKKKKSNSLKIRIRIDKKQLLMNVGWIVNKSFIYNYCGKTRTCKFSPNQNWRGNYIWRMSNIFFYDCHNCCATNATNSQFCDFPRFYSFSLQCTNTRHYLSWFFFFIVQHLGSRNFNGRMVTLLIYSHAMNRHQPNLLYYCLQDWLAPNRSKKTDLKVKEKKKNTGFVGFIKYETVHSDNVSTPWHSLCIYAPIKFRQI